MSAGYVIPTYILIDTYRVEKDRVAPFSNTNIIRPYIETSRPDQTLESVDMRVGFIELTL